VNGGTKADFQDSARALKNIQQILAQLLVNRNIKDTGGNHDEEEYNNDERLKMEKSKEIFSIDTDIIKGLQA